MARPPDDPMDQGPTVDPTIVSTANTDPGWPPTEPFPCPACGQMLAANVRVCVACKQPIDPAAIQQLPSPVSVAPPEPGRALPRARFSWGIFLVVFGITWLSATLCVQLFGVARSQMLFVLVQLVCSTWVFFDARLKTIPGPLRWVLGTLLMWIVVFPWYLSRRRTPQHPCPFIEGQAGPRVLLAILVVVFLLGVVIAVLRGPAG